MSDAKDTYSKDEASLGKQQLGHDAEQPHRDTNGVSEASVNDEQNEVLQDDIGLKGSLATGIVHLIPDASVGTFVSASKTSLLGVGSATVAAGGIAAAAASAAKIATSSVVLIVVGGLLLVSLVAGGVALVTTAGNESTTGAETQQTVDQSYTVNYAVGIMHIVFTDRAGNDGDVNVVGARLVEDDSVAVMITWQIVEVDTDGGAATSVLHTGNGTEPEGELFTNLEPGTYRIIFTLTDSVGAEAEISRSFTVTSIEIDPEETD